LDGIYITVFHDLFLTRYLGGHLHAQAMIELLHQQHVSGSARQILCITGAASSVFVGIVVGVFAVIAGMMMRPKRVDLTAEPQI
jgi:hypothetical protein